MLLSRFSRISRAFGNKLQVADRYVIASSENCIVRPFFFGKKNKSVEEKKAEKSVERTEQQQMPLLDAQLSEESPNPGQFSLVGSADTGSKALNPTMPRRLVRAIPMIDRPCLPIEVPFMIHMTNSAAISAVQAMVKRGESHIAVFLRRDSISTNSGYDGVHDSKEAPFKFYDCLTKTRSLVVSPNGHTGAPNAANFAIDVISKASDIFHIGSLARIIDRHYTPKAALIDDVLSQLSPEVIGKKLDSASNVVKEETSEEKLTLVLLPVKRVAIKKFFSFQPLAGIEVDFLDDDDSTITYSEETEVSTQAYFNELLSSMRQLFALSPMLKESAAQLGSQFFGQDQVKLSSLFASMASMANGYDLQKLLEWRTKLERYSRTDDILKKELKLLTFQAQIQKKNNEAISDQQRKYMLQEQLKLIKKELGIEKDEKMDLASKFVSRLADIKKADPDKEVISTIEREIDKLQTLDERLPEFGVTREYLEWLTGLPYGKRSSSESRLKSPSLLMDARRILDEDHFGMNEVKSRILEFIAVGKLNAASSQARSKDGAGKILCFIGPPGVGKTSIGRSIARALGREFYRFSVGGLSDVAEIKGHRRTYIGAIPGKLIQCLKTTGTEDPLVLIDEIDKLGGSGGYRGDPASALLEVLDPSQNYSFRDHYLDVPIDLSKILFICTANVDDTIPEPLLDRMEVIRLSGYDVPDKMQIAKKYLIPRHKSAALGSVENDNDVSVSDDALDQIIRYYCREAGVRNLDKHIGKIYRKFALMAASSQEGISDEGLSDLIQQSSRHVTYQDKVVNIDNLESFIGRAIFSSERLYAPPHLSINERTSRQLDESTVLASLPHGVVLGLAWTSLGGSVLYIETINVENDKGGYALTGNVGQVMTESMKIAYSYAQYFLRHFKHKYGENDADDSKSTFFDKNFIHMHIPEGAVPKDGPSAGITMVSALLGLALKKRLAKDIAMTGEVSLTGKVLKIGGLKEKLMAARRAGVKHILMPEDNRHDYDDLPEHLKRDSVSQQVWPKAYFARTYEDVYDVIFSPAESDSSTSA